MFDMINIFEVFLPQLLRYPNPTDPLNGEAAALLMRDPKTYELKVKGLLLLSSLPSFIPLHYSAPPTFNFILPTDTIHPIVNRIRKQIRNQRRRRRSRRRGRIRGRDEFRRQFRVRGRGCGGADGGLGMKFDQRRSLAFEYLEIQHAIVMDSLIRVLG